MFSFLDSTARSAWTAGTSEQAQLEALAALWSGNVEARYYSAGGTLLTTVQHAAWSIDTATDPRRLRLGAWVSESKSANGTAAYALVALPGSTVLVRCDASLAGQILSTNGRTNLANELVIVATASLPADGLPTWMTAAVGEWAQISGLTVPAQVSAFSSPALRDDGTAVELFFALGGGHSSGYDDNSVKTIDLTASAPSITVRRAASSTAGLATDGSDAYMPSDGRPVTRHTYNACHWVPEISGYMVGGLFWGSGGTTDSYPYIDAFIPSGSAGDWRDVPGPTAWSSVPATAGGYYALPATRDPATGYWYATARDDSWDFYKMHPTTGAWTAITRTGLTPGTGSMTHGPLAWDSTRSKIFIMGPMSYLGGGSAIATRITPSSGLVEAITFNSSSAWTAFQSNVGQMVSPALAYDNVADKFYFYNGRTGTLGTGDAGTVYVITPNSGTTWDMEILPTSGTPPGVFTDGVIDKFRFIPRWGVAVVARGGSDLYYCRMR